MNTHSSSVLASVSTLLSSIPAASSLNGTVDAANMDFPTSTSPPTNLSPMDITEGGPSESREDIGTPMNTSSGQPSPETSRQNSQFTGTPSASTAPSSTQSSASFAQTTSSIKFPKPAAQLSHVISPTPPASTPRSNTAPTSITKTSPRQSRPQLISRLSSRTGGKRHASIGSAREVPLPGPPLATTTTDPATLVQSPTQVAHPHNATTEGATQSWNARLREMGLHIASLGSPGRATPRTPKSGTVSSGAASPKSPEEQRAGSYFLFRRRSSSGNVTSPGKARNTAATPPPPPSPPPPFLHQHAPEAAKRQQTKDKVPSSIPEEVPSPAAPGPKHSRANFSLDLSTPLASRGSTASLPLIGHTPVEHLVQGESKRPGSMVAPAAPPPHVHTPPIHPPAYEYPFLPHHAPRQPLEVRVEENPPGPNPGDGGSWIISVRLPGFQPDGITVGTRRGRVLMIVADNYNEDDGAGHFERRISFGYDADMAVIRAEFNGDMLRVTVPRRWFGSSMMAQRNTLGGGWNVARPTVEDPHATAGDTHP